MGRIIAITNQKGGVGKTTTAINLSACVAQRGYRTLLIDMDPQGNATSGLGQAGKGERSIYDVLIEHAPLGETVVDTGYFGLALVPSHINLAGAEIELVDMQRREGRLRDALDAVRDDYDYLFLDCPPSLSLLTINALTAADGMLIPIQCEYFALEGVGQLMNTLSLVRKRLNIALEVEGIVLTMLDTRTNLGTQVAEEVRKHFGERVFSAAIPRNVRLSEAPSYGLPIELYDPRCPGAAAYRELAEALCERGGAGHA